MPHGDKYIGLTNYLKHEHMIGNDKFTMSFYQIEQACGFPLTHSMRTYFWANDRTQSYALGWLLADFVVEHCDLQGEQITYRYDPQKVRELFAGNGRILKNKRSSKVISIKSANDVENAGILPITNENIDQVNALFQKDVTYRTDGKLISEAFNRFPENKESAIVAMKVSLIDLTNSTHIGLHRERIFLDQLVQIILNIPNFDERVANGDPELVNLIAKSNGKINLYSFASKYCLYHNTFVYHRDDYSIYDSVVAAALPQYVYGLTRSEVDRWRKAYDYESFKNCITKVLDDNKIDLPNRRRKFDIFLWYLNRKDELLNLKGAYDEPDFT